MQDPLERLGDFSEIEEILKEVDIDEVILAIPNASTKETHLILDRLEKYNKKIKFVPKLNGTYTFSTKVSDYDGVLVISTNKIEKRIYDRVLKRSLDVVGALSRNVTFRDSILIYR